MTAFVLLGVSLVPSTKVRVLNGRRGPSGPGPGSVLLIRCARCKWNPREPRYPTSTEVLRPTLFCRDKFHCWTYCAGECGSNAVKLTVVAGKSPVPRTGSPKLNPDLNSAAGGVKLSACCVSGKT